MATFLSLRTDYVHFPRTLTLSRVHEDKEVHGGLFMANLPACQVCAPGANPESGRAASLLNRLVLVEF